MDFSEEIAALEKALREKNRNAATHIVQGKIARKLGVKGNVAAVKEALGLSASRSAKSLREIVSALKRRSAAPAENPAPAEKTLVERISILEEQNKNLEERIARLERIIAENDNFEKRFEEFKRKVFGKI